NGLYKAEVIHRKSWKNRTEVEQATLTWVDWYNNRRLLERLKPAVIHQKGRENHTEVEQAALTWVDWY
ncbi:IS3 family transposase, partial [Escherichia coli]|uniref:IS3 family transposase n=1 Tax=Escherichia coli TaxID=562 RepID=UPI00207D32ED